MEERSDPPGGASASSSALVITTIAGLGCFICLLTAFLFFWGGELEPCRGERFTYRSAWLVALPALAGAGAFLAITVGALSRVRGRDWGATRRAAAVAAVIAVLALGLVAGLGANDEVGHQRSNLCGP